MTSRTDDLVIHQLLGRLVYFHCLFIEPALAPTALPRDPGPPCCNHRSLERLATVGQLLPITAWAVVAAVASSLPARTQPCPDRSDDCCVTCTIVNSGATIAETWATTEHAAYGQPQPTAATLHGWGQAASSRLGTAFALQYDTACRTLEEINAASDARPDLVDVEELPLLGELLGLWADPATVTHHPVASWLNHCTDLHDIRAVTQTRRAAT